MPTVTVTVRDATSLAPISGVLVYHGGSVVGSSDGSGQLGFSGTTSQLFRLVFWKEFYTATDLVVSIGASNSSYTLNLSRHAVQSAPGFGTEGGYVAMDVLSTCPPNQGVLSPIARTNYVTSGADFTYLDWTFSRPMFTGDTGHYYLVNFGSYIRANVAFNANSTFWPDGEVTVNFAYLDARPLENILAQSVSLPGTARRVVGGTGTNAHALAWFSPTSCPVIDSGSPTVVGGGGIPGSNNVGGPGLLSMDLLPDGRKLLARVTGGGIYVDRYNTTYPAEAVAATVTVTSSGGKAVSLRTRHRTIADRRGSIVDLLSVEGDTVYHRTSRNQGRTWSVASTVASGQGCTMATWVRRGLILAAYYELTNTRWMLKIGTVGTDGVTVTWGSAQVLVTSAKNAGQLLLDSNGIPYFVYTTSGDVVTLLRCRSITKAGVGTWS